MHTGLCARVMLARKNDHHDEDTPIPGHPRGRLSAGQPFRQGDARDVQKGKQNVRDLPYRSGQVGSQRSWEMLQGPQELAGRVREEEVVAHSEAVALRLKIEN